MAKPKALTKAQLSAKLVEIVNATNANTVLYTSATEHGPLVEQGLVEVNPQMVDGNGNIATRATSKGIEQTMNTNTGTADAGTAAPAAAKPTFTLENAALPAISGRGRAGVETYPFEQMAVGQSFFVPATADKSNPAKSLASTVSSATKRYAEVVPGQTKKNKAGEDVPVLKETRKFVVRSRTAAAEAAEGFNHGQNGARVYRTA